MMNNYTHALPWLLQAHLSLRHLCVVCRRYHAMISSGVTIV